MSRTKYKTGIIDFYGDFLEAYPLSDSGVVGWTTRESQSIRFAELCKIGIGSENTVLDLGCGVGHLLTHLQEQFQFPIENYTGVDINPYYVSYAATKTPQVICGEIFDVTGKYDYVIGSGVFTVMMTREEILSAIAGAYERCKKGLAFNFLTTDYLIEETVNSFDPEIFFKEISSIYPNSKLVTGYLDNEDFTIYILKDEQ